MFVTHLYIVCLESLLRWHIHAGQDNFDVMHEHQLISSALKKAIHCKNLEIKIDCDAVMLVSMSAA